MKIGIDARVLDRPITGTGRVLINLLNELPNCDSKNQYYIISSKEHNFNANYYDNIKIAESIIPDKLYSPFYLNFILPEIIKRNKIELLYEPNILLPIVKMKNIRTMAMVHDVIPRIFKELYPLSYRTYLALFLSKSLNASDIVLTVSEHSKKDISKFYNVKLDKIKVLYNTASRLFTPRDTSQTDYPECLKSMNLPEKYLLFVGVFDRRKNVIALLKILDIIRSRGSNLKLVMIGKGGYNFSKIEKEFEKRNDYIKRYRFVSDEVLKYLYNYSFAFIFPSLYEGFGIPPLEAMQSGIPVITSNTSSLCEVVGNGGLTHNPDDYDGFADDILRLENDACFYNDMKEKAIEQAKKFSIKNVATEFVKTINGLIK